MKVVYLPILFQILLIFLNRTYAHPRNSNEKADPSIYTNENLNYHENLKNNQHYIKANIKKDATVLDKNNWKNGRILQFIKQRHNHYMLKKISKFITNPQNRTNFKNQKIPIKCKKISNEKFSNYEYNKNLKRICHKFYQTSKLKPFNKRIASTYKDIETQSYTSTETNYLTTNKSGNLYQRMFNWKEVLILVMSSVLLTCSIICCCVSLARTFKSQRTPRQKSEFKVDTWLASNQNNSGMMFCFPKIGNRISEESISSCKWSQRSKQKNKSKIVCQCSSTNSSMSVA